MARSIDSRTATRFALLLVTLALLSSVAFVGSPVDAASDRVGLKVRLRGDGEGLVAASVLRNGNEVGTCRRNACDYSVPRGITLTFSALPSRVSEFNGWGGACAAKGLPCELKMGTGRTVVARFSRSDVGETREAINNYLANFTWSPAKPPDVVGESYSEVAGNVVCTVTPQVAVESPERVLTQDRRQSGFWLGGFLQGASFLTPPESDNPGVSALPISSRAPVTVYADVLGPNVFQEVTRPNPATMQSAIGSLVADIDEQELVRPQFSDVRWIQASSIEQSLLQLGLSARYLIAEAEASLDVQRDANESSVAGTLIQEYFTVNVVPPSTPADWFDLTSTTLEDLQEQQDVLRRIGTENPPLVVTGVTYGRVFVISAVSEASSEALSAAVNGSLRAANAGGSVKLTAEQRDALAGATINVLAIGGDEKAILNAVRTQDFEEILEPISVHDLVPISYRVEYVADASAARPLERYEYEDRVCDQQGLGVLAKVTRLRAYTPTCDLKMHGRLHLNDALVFVRPQDEAGRQVPVGAYWELGGVEWPTFDPSSYGLGDGTYPDNGLYFAWYHNAADGPTSAKIELVGSLEGDRRFPWEQDSHNVYNYVEDAPISDFGRRSIQGTDALCPIELEFYVEKVADLDTPKPLAKGVTPRSRPDQASRSNQQAAE